MISGYQQEDVIGIRYMDNILIHIKDQGKSLYPGLCPIEKIITDNCGQEAEVYLHYEDGQMN
jgi:hypothetical protein